ncbi:hypothetical protein ACGFMK_23895 [Amycolatopsis sp. NPDC049252]|uniref:hypothetical protein n=1 Tax=Amycolatopsis sp. NPDC049252 TaxID=3363933 RepID=UPI003721C13A
MSFAHSPARSATVQLWPEWLETAQNTPHDVTAIAIGTTPYDTAMLVDIPAFDLTRMPKTSGTHHRTRQ